MKPREFWILDNEAYTCEQDTGILHAPEQIHVREVVPFNWNKIWLKFEKFSAGNNLLSECDKDMIEELIEKQLKGEK